VTQTIVQQVVDGEFSAGDWLPREVDLAERHGISRGVARETIQALRERGVVMVRHGRGAQVLPEREWNLLDPVVLRALVSADERRDVLRDLIECRRIVEPPVAALAAERATASDVVGLAAALQAMQDAPATVRRSATDEHPFVRAEIAFHRTLVAIAGNRPLAKMLDPLHLALAVARHERAPERQPAVARVHAKVYAAVEAGQPDDARQALTASVKQLSGWLVGRRSGPGLAGQRR
jgi:GntR family transcriptional repressor for pyruvate dehydrogenase complex